MGNEIPMPQIGFGTWQLEDGKQALSATKTAIEAGYRLIDTAKIYGNEVSVGQAIAENLVRREEVFLTTKLWPSDFERAHEAFEESLQRLGLDYVDLYLIHWPSYDSQARQLAWRAMEEIKAEGLSRHIGVSNFDVSQLEELLDYAKQPPAVNQIEFHPFIYEQQRLKVDFCQQQGIAVEAYSPLARAHQLNEPVMKEIAAKHAKTVAQIMLRWAIQHQTIPIPKSAHPQRIAQNLEVFDFNLSQQQMEAIDQLSN